MQEKKKRFRLDNSPEKKARLDVRITDNLRLNLENFCRKNKILLTVAVTEALESFLETHKDK
jgi:hypothetical protein